MSDLFSGLTETIKSTANAITKNEHVRKFAESMNDAIMNYPKAQMDVREATNEDPWGPTGPQMKKIAEYTRSRYMEDFYNVYTPLFARMLENNKDAWRRVYKSLILLDYLLKNGSERFVQEAREKTYELRRLESYKYIDEKGKDQGINIRHRVKQILELLNDDDLLQAERKKANSDDKSKYKGYDKYDINNSGMKSSSSSNFDNNWDRGGSSSSSTNKKWEDDFKSKEVSNFSFRSSTNNRSPSPELGFVDEKKQKEVEDDGFGDFVSSRSSNPAAKSRSTPNPPKSFFDSSVPAIPPPSAANYVAPPLSPIANKKTSNVDLLFDLDAPTPSASATTTSGSVDLLSNMSFPVTNAPAPNVPAASADSLFDFGAPPVAQQPVSQMVAPIAPKTTNPNGAIGFSGFDFTSAVTTSSIPPFAPLQAMSGQQQQPTQAANQINLGGPAPKVGNSFAGLDQFMGLSLGSTNANAPKAKTLNQMKGGPQ
ncbi:CRE-RSD-3 protein [Caenorhabditis remanei]|uniref:CRE-RSD-3 protein n=1 Tax=Caenorhabditis remanei TaxID=31234 RepID=E3MZH2_CAERE|nr:CRE-RSD-3 protein [Caenorhabditis remanei]